MGSMKDQLGGEPYQPQAYARTTDLETSHAAARRVERKVGHLEIIVARCIWLNGDRGATWHEIAAQAGLDPASVSPRLKPLRKRSLIEARVSDGKIIKRDHQTVWYRHPHAPVANLDDLE